MLTDQFLISTHKQPPSDANAASHRLLSQGGYIVQHGSGLYSFSHLGQRVMDKIKTVIVTEMTKVGGLHMQMPIMQPEDIWQASQRWDAYTSTKQMFVVEDRKGTEYGLAPTAEEIATLIAKQSVRTVGQLPFTVFQIGQKFRDELRPRNGLMRTKEFSMMDAYSFDANEAGLAGTYDKIKEGYYRIFNKMGLHFRPVAADMGEMGGIRSEEFMALADIGEDTILYTDGDYAANSEMAVSNLDVMTDEEMKSMAIDLLTPENTKKLLEAKIFVAALDGSRQKIAVLIANSHDVNEVKLKNILKASEVIATETRASFDLHGDRVVINGNIARLVIDESALHMPNASLPTAAEGIYINNVNISRDLPEEQAARADVRLAKAGEMSPEGLPFKSAKGIEIGHIFQLGTRYTSILKAGYADAEGKFNPFLMGCYGIGVSRVMAAIVEQNNNGKGICWPYEVAPFHIHLVPVSMDDPLTKEKSLELHNMLQEANIDVLLDTRTARLGVKLHDADLIGSPYQIVIGRDIVDDKVEFRDRKTGEIQILPFSEITPGYLASLEKRKAAANAPERTSVPSLTF
jgi:prolyl-tRNA synthetase